MPQGNVQAKRLCLNMNVWLFGEQKMTICT